jgi:hypothetical protein
MDSLTKLLQVVLQPERQRVPKGELRLRDIYEQDPVYLFKRFEDDYKRLQDCIKKFEDMVSKAKPKDPWVWPFSYITLAFLAQAANPMNGNPDPLFNIRIVMQTPEIHFEFDSQPGETHRDMRERCKREFEARLKQITPQPQGRMPGDSTTRITRKHTEWYYRHKFCGDSIRGIATAHNRKRGVKDGDARSDVRYGICQIDALLSDTKNLLCP